VELSPRGAAGIYKILQGCISTLNAVQAPVQDWLTDPVSVRFREAQALADHEYRRGLREGAAALVRSLEQQAPELAGILRPWIADDVLAPAAPAAGAPDTGPATYPRFADREPDDDTDGDPDADATDRTGTDG
ncbi:hypothetical protein, partial [Roseospira navarrensis]|uniref:hypothetical protein n=1 Tax=Roseospira navarrensis TaxID=140058 RepID=UPI001B8719C1